MAARLSWASDALADVDALAEYIARDSPYYASSVVKSILASARKLKRFPQLGAMVPELSDPSIRELGVHSYRLIYQVQGRDVVVLGVIHARRLLDPIAQRFKP